MIGRLLAALFLPAPSLAERLEADHSRLLATFDDLNAVQRLQSMALDCPSAPTFCSRFDDQVPA